MIRVVIADDHRIVREGVRRLLGDTGDIRIVGEAVSGQEALRAIEESTADVLLLDVSMPGSNFSDTLRAVRDRHPTLRVIVMSAHAEEEYAVRALKGGAAAYVTKERSPEELIEAIRAAAAGRRFISPSVGELLAAEAARDSKLPAHGRLSDRELDVLRLLASGRSVKEAAAELGLSAKTVSTYRTRLMEKLGLRSTAELIRYALEQKLA